MFGGKSIIWPQSSTRKIRDRKIHQNRKFDRKSKIPPIIENSPKNFTKYRKFGQKSKILPKIESWAQNPIRLKLYQISNSLQKFEKQSKTRKIVKKWTLNNYWKSNFEKICRNVIANFSFFRNFGGNWQTTFYEYYERSSQIFS